MRDNTLNCNACFLYSLFSNAQIKTLTPFKRHCVRKVLEMPIFTSLFTKKEKWLKRSV